MAHTPIRKASHYRSRRRVTKNDLRRAALDAVALNRRNPGMTLDEAARRSATTVASIRQHAPSAVTSRNGRWRVTTYDTEPRRLRLLTERGYVSILTTDSRQSTLIADYNNAIRDFLQTGSQKNLRKFEGYSLVINGRKTQLLTDTRTILRLARAGEIQFIDLYADGEV